MRRVDGFNQYAAACFILLIGALFLFCIAAWYLFGNYVGDKRDQETYVERII